MYTIAPDKQDDLLGRITQLYFIVIGGTKAMSKAPSHACITREMRSPRRSDLASCNWVKEGNVNKMNFDHQERQNSYVGLILRLDPCMHNLYRCTGTPKK